MTRRADIETFGPPFLPLLGTGIAIALYVAAVIYHIASGRCDGVLWVLIILALVITIVSSILAFLNYVHTRTALSGELKTCPPDKLAKTLYHQPLFSKLIGGLLIVVSIGLYIAAIVYYVATNHCGPWFWALLTIAFILDIIAGLVHFMNTRFHLKVAETQLELCGRKTFSQEPQRKVTTVQPVTGKQ